MTALPLLKLCFHIYGEVLRLQRGNYYGFGDTEEEYLVFEQCDSIDQTKVYNLQMERHCANTDHRLKKKDLDSASRDSPLSQTHSLGDQVSRDYQKIGNVVKIIDDIKAE